MFLNEKLEMYFKLKSLKAVILSCIFAMAFTMAEAVDIKMQKATFDDYIPLLEMAGYNVYSFDIKSLNDKSYRLAFSCREYMGDSLVSKNIILYPAYYGNMRLLSQFSKKFQDTIKPEEMYDSIRGIYKCAEKIVVGTFSENDSTTLMSVNVDKMASFSFSLNLKSINNPVSGQTMYFYKTRPFIVGECRTDEFIPLVFYGSSWFDSKYNVIRFCGESELNPDMSDQIIKDVPHSFVLGFSITEMTD